MRVSVWGCRGSLPSPGPEKNRYGGNTSCIHVKHGDSQLILDGGSGIQRLGIQLVNNATEYHILLTHLHIDHTMGLGFFLPLYNPKVTIHLYGPASSIETLTDRLRRYFSPPLFPVRLSELPNHPVIHEVTNGEFEIGDFKITANYICHPSATLGYRIQCEDKVFTYMPDHELPIGACNFPNDPEWTSGYDIAKDADLLFHDAQYKTDEYQKRLGWGHSSFKNAQLFGEMCNVKQMEFFHHDPYHTDEDLDRMFTDHLASMPIKVPVGMCAEGNVYEL